MTSRFQCPSLTSLKSFSNLNLWLLLVFLTAAHCVVMSILTQGVEDGVNVLLVWGGAMIICSDCQKTGWGGLQPSRLGLALGSGLLLFVLWRSLQISTLNATSGLLSPLAGLGLALLAASPRRLSQFRTGLQILALLPLMVALVKIFPSGELSLVTAQLAQLFLQLFGLPVRVIANEVRLLEGAVQVAGPCSGVGMLVQLLAVGLIFILAFPMHRRWQCAVMVLIAPLLAMLTNAGRIAILALLNCSNSPVHRWWFQFLHESGGSLLFAGLAVLQFAWLYGFWMDRQIDSLESR